ncbi:hydrolase [Pseudoalteromonas gelatinilytica]|uniref:Hydrolase n=2 Tax=Pseudoalteromonas gelatinilytica TaxID=1703256 RepID=A0A3A3EPW0_9GAMM|nr:hydrolase [Pseudoalteromonas profundi]
MKFLKWLAIATLCIVIGVFIMNNQLAAEGVSDNSHSAQLSDGKFHNSAEVERPSFKKTLGIFKRFITEKKIDAEPKGELPMHSVSHAQLERLSNDTVHFVKLGHSSILAKVYGEYWLFDPVFSERASPFSFMGPKRFQPTPISIAELPNIAKVFISHNHYDHLDKAAIKQLVDKTDSFYVPLGVENDLKKWGVDEQKVHSFDWWQEQNMANSQIVFTPTQHFSGRGLTDGNKTLWGSWAIKVNDKRFYFSGDSGYFAGFKEIGHRYGPFDITFIETGAYDKDWADIHMTPEQSVQAHLDLQGDVMVPVHNGTFDLAFHAWYDPLKRVAKKAGQEQVSLSTPLVGEVFKIQDTAIDKAWW